MIGASSLLQNRYIKAFLLFLSVAAHLCLAFALDARIYADKKPMLLVPQATTVTLVSAPGLFPVTLQASATYPRVDKDHAQHVMPSQARHTSTSAVPKNDSAAQVALPVLQEKEDSVLSIVRPEEPYYFTVHELSESPQVMLDLSPSLAFSLTSGLPQLAVLRLFINELGGIDQVLIDDSPLSDNDQRLVSDTFSKTKFQPGKIDGVPVKSQLKIEVRLDSGFDNQ